jgi:shikimate kinase
MKRVIILIGPKGVGKTSIGTSIERMHKIPFIKVETLLLNFINNTPDAKLPLPRDGFDIEEFAIHQQLRITDTVIFEATGSSKHFPSVITNLKALYDVLLIRIRCPLDVCLQRVINRTTDNHFVMTEHRIMEINLLANSIEYDWNIDIENDGILSIDEIASRLFYQITKLPNV